MTIDNSYVEKSSTLSIPSTTVFLATSKQVLVRDDVVFQAGIDPYIALTQANERLKAGLGIFAWDKVNASLK